MVVHLFGSDYPVIAVDNDEDVDWWKKDNGDSDEDFVDDENKKNVQPVKLLPGQEN